MSRSTWLRRTALGALVALALLGSGCQDAIFDAAAVGALDLLQGSVTGVGGYLIFGEDPPPLIFNSILNAIGSGGGGGGGGGAHH